MGGRLDNERVGVRYRARQEGFYLHHNMCGEMLGIVSSTSVSEGCGIIILRITSWFY